MTPIEREMGRFMRAPDGHDGGEGGGDGAGGEGGDAPGSDAGAEAGQGGDQGGDGSTLLGGATGTEAGADGAGADGDGKAPDADGGEGEGGDDDKKADDADDQVPEAYALEPIKLGEGDDAQTIEIDTKLLADVTPMLKEAGITAGQLKQIAPAVAQVQSQVLAALNDDFAATRAGWEKAAREDKDIGGAKMPETLALAARALDAFGAKSEIKEIDGQKVETNEFRALLNDTGLGNHPVMLKMFREVGKLVGEDSELIRPDTNPNGKVDSLAALYPDDVPKEK